MNSRKLMIMTISQIWVAVFCVTAVSVAEFHPGIPVGSKIPPFEAKDQQGVVQTFEKIRGPKGAFLVFFRSADW